MRAFWTQHATRKRLVAAAVSVALLSLAIRRVDAAAMKASLDTLDYGWFFAGMAAFGLACLFGASRWHCMLVVNRCAVRPWATLRATLLGQLCNTLLFGPAGGDIVKATLYARWHRFPLPSILAACWMDRLLAAMGSMLFAVILILLAREKAVAALAGKLDFAFARWIPTVCLLALVILGVWAWKRKRPESILSRAIGSLNTGLAAVSRAPVSGMMSVLLSVGVQVCLSSVMAFNLRACSHDPVPWGELFWIFPVVSLLTALPITIAGIGVREGASIMLLGLFGVPASAALTASFLTLATNLIWALAGALIWWREECSYKHSRIE